MNLTNKVRVAVVGTIVILSGILAFPLLLAGDSVKQDEKIINNTKEEKLLTYLDELENFECPHCKPNFKRLDSNGKFSYGCLQFQLQTWLTQYKKYYDTGEPDSVIVSRIFNCTDQKNVAKKMFEDDVKKASLHWYTSIYKKGLGLPNV